MQNFENIEDLVVYMFDKLNGDEPVSVVADKDLAVAVLKELLDYNDIVLDICDIDSFEYDREYLVTLYDEVDTDFWHVSVEQIYNYEKEMYFGTDGYILFHEDVNSKALIDMQKNKFIELSGYDWFTISEDTEIKEYYTINGEAASKEEFDKYVSQFTNEDNKRENSKELSSASTATYCVNGKQVDKTTYDKAVSDIEGKYLDNMRDMLLSYCEFMDGINEWRKMLRW